MADGAAMDVDVAGALGVERQASGSSGWSSRAPAMSEHGECAESACACDAAWRGDRCQTLALEPAGATDGLRLVSDGGVNVSTWGGSVLRDPATWLFHMWASEMGLHCGIDAWRSNRCASTNAV